MQGLGNVSHASRFHLMTRPAQSLQAPPTPPERVNRGEAVAGTLQHARSQFEITIQSFRAIRTEEGEFTREVRFSLEGSVELLTGDPDETEALESLDPLERLREFFSPENTAERIARFAIVGYKGPDTEDGRAAYAEAIGEAIKSGIQEARDILAGLGALPEATTAGIDETESLVEQKLQAFAKLGAPTLEPGRQERALAFRASLSIQLERSTTVTLYDAGGATREPSVAASFAAVA